MMKRGEIYFANLNPTMGSEINKTRPVLVVSNNANNKAGSTVTVLPITSNIKKVYPFEVKLNKAECGLQKTSKVQCQQIRTLSKLRIKSKPAGAVNINKMLQVESAMRLHLDLT